MSVYGQQFGFADEGSNWGVVATPDHFLPLLGPDAVEWTPTFARSMALKAGVFGSPVSRMKRIRYGAAGTLPLELTYSKLGLLIRQAMGSSVTTPTNITGTAYKQVHQIGSTDGHSLTMQLGRNEVSTGTVKPFTAVGSKVLGFSVAVSDGDTDSAQLALTIDAKDEATSTALAAASYPTGSNAGAFTFADVTAVKLGGTAATTSGVVAITGGTQATTVLNSLSLDIAVPGKTDRYGLGNQGAKLEQKNNAQPTVTGSFAGEFTLQSEIYDVWKAGTTVPLQITFQSATQIASTGQFYTFDVILPAVKILTAPPHSNSYDIPTQAVTWEAYVDDVNGNNLCQVTYINADSTL